VRARDAGAGLLTLLIASGALAHGIVLEVGQRDEPVITGQVRYTDDSPVARTLIRIEDRTDGTLSTLLLRTDETGAFAAPGLAGHRYVVIADGDEGHRETQEIELRRR
jgi:hypothetical protein